MIVILNQKLAMLSSSGGNAKGGGKKNPRTISGGMDVLNTAQGETEFQHVAPVDVKLFPISGRVWKFNFTAGETISNKHSEEEEEEEQEGRRKREGRG